VEKTEETFLQPTDEWADWPCFRVHCPVCGYEYVHIEDGTAVYQGCAVQVVKSGEEVELRPQTTDVGEALLDVPMSCECEEHTFILRLWFHKGQTFVRMHSFGSL
jgi:hypothetical protein